MHWGIRRFQNADGTYTLLGKMRKRENRQATDGSNGGSPKPEKAKRRERTDLSDKTNDELRSAISRMELEKKYRDLEKSLNPEKEHKVKELIKEAGRNALKAALEKHLKTILGAGDSKGKGQGQGQGKGKGGQQNNGRSELYEEHEARRVKAQIGLNRLNQELRAQEAQMREQREAERREREEQRRRERAVRSIESHRWMY